MTRERIELQIDGEADGFVSEIDRAEQQTRAAAQAMSEALARVDDALEIGNLDKIESAVKGARAALDDLGRQPLQLDTSAAREAVERLEALLRGLQAEPVIVEADTEEAENQLDELKRQVRKLSDEDGVIEIDADTRQAVRELRSFRRDVDRQLKALTREAKRSSPFVVLADSAKRDGAALLRQFQLIEAGFTRAVAKLERESRRPSFEPQSKQARRLRENVLLAAQEVERFARRVPPDLRKVGKGFEQVEQRAREARDEIRRFNQRVNETPGSVNTLRGALQDLSTTIKGDLINAVKGFLAALVVQQLLDFATAAVKVAANLDVLDRRFKAVTGSEEKAAERLQRLREISDLFGADLKGLRDNYAPFIKSLERSNLELRTQEAIYEALAIAATGAGAGNVKFQRAMAAVVQIASKGKVELEELTGQLAEALPGGLDALAAKLDITRVELFKLTRQGQLLAEEALPAIASGMLEAFGPAALEGLDAANTQFNRAKNLIEDLQKALGEKLLPGVLEVLKALQGVGDDGEGILSRAGDLLGFLLEKLASLLRILGDIANFRFDAALAEGFAVIVRLADQAQTAILGVLDAVSQIVPPINRVIKNVRESVDGFLDGLQKGAEETAAKWRQGAEETVSATERANDAIQQSHDTLQKALDQARKEQARKEKEAIQSSEKARKEADARALESVKAHFEEYVDAAQQAYKQAADATKEGNTEAARAAFLAAKQAAEDAKDVALQIIEETAGAESKAVDAARRAAEKAVEFAQKAYDQMVEAAKKAAEEEEKIHTKRRKLFEDAANDLAEAFQAPDEPNQPSETVRQVRVTGGADVGLTSQLSTLRRELAALEAQKRRIEAAPIITPEQLGQVDEMRSRIAELSGEISVMERQVSETDLAGPVTEGADQITQRGQAVLDTLRNMTLDRGSTRLIDHACHSSVLEETHPASHIDESVEYAEDEEDLQSLCLQKLREGSVIRVDLAFPALFALRPGMQLFGLLPVIGLRHLALIEEVEHVAEAEGSIYTLARGIIRAI